MRSNSKTYEGSLPDQLASIGTMAAQVLLQAATSL